MEQQKEETETYTCGIKFDAQPVDNNGDQSYIEFEVPMTKMNAEFKVTDKSFGSFSPYGSISGNKRVETKDYELTEEEHKAFNELEGCTPEEIAIAKKVLAKTIQVPIGTCSFRNTGVNSNSPFPVTKLQDRLDELDYLKKQMLVSMQHGSVTVGKAVAVMNANTFKEVHDLLDCPEGEVCIDNECK